MAQGTESRGGVLWTPEHRATTAGLLLLVTLIAFENLGVATAMPTMVTDLGGGELYSWPFTAFLVATSLLIALVYTDRERPVSYAANAAAWVLPAVIGPSIAGFVTDRFGGRWVFHGLVVPRLAGLHRRGGRSRCSPGRSPRWPCWAPCSPEGGPREQCRSHERDRPTTLVRR